LAQTTLMSRVADIVLGRRPLTDLDGLVADWRTGSFACARVRRSYAADWFDPEHWLAVPTETMRVFELSDAGQMAQLRHKVRTARLTTLTTEPTGSSPGSS
jgi:hypothetical protein